MRDKEKLYVELFLKSVNVIQNISEIIWHKTSMSNYFRMTFSKNYQMLGWVEALGRKLVVAERAQQLGDDDVGQLKTN